MSIRSKLAWTFIILLIFGITAISSYSILFIRNFLLKEGVENIRQDSEWMVETLRNIPMDRNGDLEFNKQVQAISKTTEYQLAIYDSAKHLINVYPTDSSRTVPATVPNNVEQQTLEGHTMVLNDSRSPKLMAWAQLPGSSNQIRFMQISQNKDQYYKPIKTIRWIIYSGMFISMALVIIVSILFARYISRPIVQLKDAAEEIADGDVKRQIHLNRNDEFGKLANSLNKMAHKLRADNRELQKINEQQRRFFADITHEIKNPLHTISGSLEMLELDELPEEQQEKYIKNAQKQTQRINRLYRDLVTLQRYESDDYFIQPRPFDLSRIARHLRELYHDKAAEKGLSLNITDRPCLVMADPEKIEQVLENLISNAIKYTSKGQITLDYRTQNETVVLEVKDTGIGIDERHLDHLFDRFYRTDKARSRDKGGTGLGLSVVKSILNAHGQKIDVSSKPDEGTTFWFKLATPDETST